MTIVKNRSLVSKIVLGLLCLSLISLPLLQPATAATYTPLSVSTYKSTFGFYGHTTANWANTMVDVRKYQPAFAAEMALAKKYAPLLKVDPVMLVWWTYIETGSPGAKFDSYHYSNCSGASSAVKYHIDRNCETPNWGGWQLGYGEQFTDVRQPGLLAAAFKAAYGDPNNATLVQKVGQNVLVETGIKGKTFPKQTIAQIISHTNTTYAVAGNYWTYTLMRDPSISVYFLVQEMAWDINGGKARGLNYRQVTAGWGSYYSTNWQKFSNVFWDVYNLWKLIDQGKKP